MIKKNVFIEGIVLDENFKKVMTFNSRFVKIDWNNLYEINIKKIPLKK